MPRLVGDYELVRELGRGGMGRVHLARQRSLRRDVALKEVGGLVESPDAAARFLREARVAGSLSHPNIVTVFEYLEVDGIAYIAMEYLPGGSLRPYLSTLELAGFAQVMEGMLAALAHARDAGIVHRDLKPENVMVTLGGSVKIGDFGLAKATESAGTLSFESRSGVIVGTPRYMAPEQIQNEAVGVRADLYSLGVIAYEQLVGWLPFDDLESPIEILLCHLHEGIPPAVEVRPTFDRNLSHWLERLLVTDPEQRIGDPEEVWEQLEEIVLDRLGPRWRRAGRLIRNNAGQATVPAGSSVHTIITGSAPVAHPLPDAPVATDLDARADGYTEGLAQPPVGTVAMLFTDIEGSTRLASRLGTGWAKVLAAHHELVSAAIVAERGYVDGTEGDAFFATFADTAAAARAAVAAQRALRAHAWPQEVGELRVRMGLHTGHVERHATGYVGLEVHRAARVAAAAHGGQLLLTAAARDLAGDALLSEPVGAHRLKDFPSPESLFCAVIDGRGAAAFPPPRAHEARPTNLPAGPPVLLGREDDVSELRRLLTTGSERLVTITGRGGAGKTSLALVAGGQLLDDHSGGVWLARLATVTGPAHLLEAVAAAVGAEGEFGSSPLAAITSRLSYHGATLLILDNLERLVAAAADIAALLEAVPDLRVLATSQVPLHLETEYVYPIDALPDEAALELIARVAHRRAVAIAPDGPGRDALLDIVHLLDGLPLALELAAARLTLMSPEQLRDRLRDSLELLREDRPDRPDRQRSLMATADWTLALLDESPRALFARLGVFAGPVELTDIEAIAGGDGVEVLDALPSLLDVALVRRVEPGDGRVRFGLPEALRQLAVQQLDANPDGVTLRRAHAERMEKIVTAARSLSVPGNIYAAALAADLEIAAALRWTRAVGDPLAISLAVGRTMVLAEEGRLREALEASALLGDVAPTDPDLHAWTLVCQVYPRAFLNRLGEAQNLAHRAVELAVQPLTRTVCLEACGLAYVFAGDAKTGLVYHREATAIARGLDPATLSGALDLEAQAHLYSGDPDRAEATAAECWRVGLPVDANYLWKRNTFYADLAMVRGRPEDALGHYVASLHAAQERDNQLQIMFDLLGTAIALAALHRDADALELVGIVRAAVFEFGGAGAEPVSHLLRDDQLTEAERRAGPAAIAEQAARGRAVPAAMRVARACELARPAEILA